MVKISIFHLFRCVLIQDHSISRELLIFSMEIFMFIFLYWGGFLQVGMSMIAKNNDDINLELQWVPFHNVYVCGFLFLSLLFVAFNRNILTQWQRNGLKWIGSMANYLCANQFCACYDSTNHILFISKWLIAVRMKNIYILYMTHLSQWFATTRTSYLNCSMLNNEI